MFFAQQEVEIQGNTSSPFHDLSDKYWQTPCGELCPYVIPKPTDFVVASKRAALIYEWRFYKTPWVYVSQGRTINGTGYWGYTDVRITWATPVNMPASSETGSKTHTAAIAVPVVVGSFLLLAGNLSNMVLPSIASNYRFHYDRAPWLKLSEHHG